MHIVWIHQNFPAQFGHIAKRLADGQKVRSTFVTNRPPAKPVGIEVVPYQIRGGATRHNSYFTRTFENSVAHAHGVYEACKQWGGRPDLVVAHSGFGSSLFLRELWNCPIINYFEYFYHPHDSDLDFRPNMPAAERDVLRSYCRNAMLLLDLENCDAGYCPTDWQRSRFPAVYQPKLTTVFDGVDTQVWKRHADAPRTIADRVIPADTRIVTYVSRGFESMRGFDVFIQAAKRIYQAYPNVIFAVVGSDRIAYGGDQRFTRGQSFREHVLSQDEYDLSKFIFTGMLPSPALAQLWSIADLHIYLTVPFVLSWSLFNALACGATVLASDTEPVRELITDRENGLLTDFFDVETLASQAVDVLNTPEDFAHLRRAGERLIEERYSLETTLPKLLELYREVKTSYEPAN